jgi:uncharacterized SAM-binding protein YcdF (DUF218 family)
LRPGPTLRGAGRFPLSHPSSRRFRRALAVTALALLTLAAIALVRLGPFMATEDPLERADAIMVLAGTRLERPLEAADLYRAGWAPRIVMTHQQPEKAILALTARGVVLPFDEDLAVDAMVQIGVPRERITLPSEFHDNTAQEARTLRQLALTNRWTRVIVVTSKFHLRRAGFAMRRELKGTNVAVVMRGSRYDPSQPQRWWASRGDIRWMMSETPKLVAYALGLGA